METIAAKVCERFEREGDDAFRLFHGRGRMVPGYEHLTVDRFGDCLHIALHRPDPALGKDLADRLAAELPVAGISIQTRNGRETRTAIAYGVVPERLVAHEAALRFWVELTRNQNVGLFLDMEPARQWLRARCAGKTVLNLFAFTCAFSVAAVAGGARKVVNNDMSRNALTWGERNHQLNDHDPRRVRMVANDVFKCWRVLRLAGPYDIVIIDPPSRQRGSFDAERQYHQVLKRIPELCAPGATILACLNSPFLPFHFLEHQMQRACPEARLDHRLPPSADFPDQSPDAALKVAVFRYR